MSRNYYSEIHLHFTWHAKLSQPRLTPAVEPFVHPHLKQRIVGTPGLFVTRSVASRRTCIWQSRFRQRF
jgi:hypothetical protein